MTPNWDHVRVFLAVARAGQFLSAARSLALDHATVARRISLLEASLGTQLFARSTAGVSLTVAGETFVAAAEAMETAWLDAQADVSQVDRVVSGTIRIGAPEGFGALFLSPRLGRLAERHPGLTIQLVPLQRTMSLSKRDADLAVVIDPPADGRPANHVPYAAVAVSASANCDSCHKGSFSSWASGRFHSNFSVTTQCASCHNGNYLAATGKPSTAIHSGVTNCETCHNPSGWTDLTPAGARGFYLDVALDEFLRQGAPTGNTFGLVEVFVALGLSFALCLMLAYFYRQSHRGLSYSVSLVHAMVLLGITFLGSVITCGGERTNMLQGAVHLVMFLVFLTLIFHP